MAEGWKSADTSAAPHNRNHCHIDICRINTDQALQNLRLFTDTFSKEYMENLFRWPPQKHPDLHTCNNPGFLITGKNFPFFINADHALVQNFQKKIQLTLQISGALEHLLKAVISGSHRVNIILEFFSSITLSNPSRKAVSIMVFAVQGR